MTSVSEMLPLLRKKKRLSQTSLAKASGVSQAAISAIERGERSPSESTIRMLADALGVTFAELTGESSARPIPTEEDIKYALLGGDGTDEEYEEVKRYAAYVKANRNKGAL